MTISSTTSKCIYTGNGSQTVFPYTFKILDEADIIVEQYTIADGTTVTLVLDTDYTVDGVEEESGGDVTLLGGAPSSDYKIIIRRNLTLTQPTAYTEGDAFPAESHEGALDRIIMICQQLKEQVDRGVLQDASQESQVTFPAPEADKLLGWNEGGTALENKDSPEDAKEAAEAAQAAAEAAQTASELAATRAETAETNAELAETNAEAAQAAAEAALATMVGAGIIVVLDGGGAAIDADTQIDIPVPFDCTITAVQLLADQTGSIKIDIWKDTYANFPPTNADTITGGNEPEISSGTKDEDSTLTSWTKTISAGDILRFNVDSCTTIQKCTVILKVTRT